MKSESYLQSECIAEFRNQIERFGKGVCIPIPNELARKRKDVVIKDGCSDIILFFDDGTVIFCELKVGYNKQQSNQIAFQKQVESLGHEYRVVRSIGEFKNILI